MLSRRKKVFLKINIVSILFAVVSLISVTLAWFAYSGLATARTEVGVKAWYIEFEKDNEPVSNDIVISLEDIYPGMEPRKEEITIKNLGDADTKLKYKVNKARILDSQNDYYEMSNNMTSDYIEDAISHNYPFHIDISLSKLYLDSKENATFEVSVSWPLDSGNNALDSLWGNNAYQYSQAQELLLPEERSPAIEVNINVTAEQAIDDLDSVDTNFLLGKKIKFDTTTGETCTSGNTCIDTYVIDTFNTVDDQYVNLLPRIDLGDGTYQDYQSINPSWHTDFRLLTVGDILKIISLDIDNSLIKINGISDRVIGKTGNTNRINSIISNVVTNSGYFTYTQPNYLKYNSCIWTSDTYSDKGFALDDTKLYGENKNTECKMIPVLHVQKSKLVVE
jgi:hypothetical protein